LDFGNVIAQVQTFFDFGCIDGCGILNWSRILKIQKKFEQNPDSHFKVETRPRIKA